MSVRGGGPGGGGQWTLAERGVSKMIVGPSAILLESWLSWELGGEGELGVGVGSGTWKPASSDDVCKIPPMCCQLAGLSSPNWALLAGPPARCLKIPRQSKNRPDKCTSRSAFQEHDASLLGTNSLLHLTQAPRYKREGKRPWTWPFSGQILKRNPAMIGPERPTQPNQAGWRFVAPQGLAGLVSVVTGPWTAARSSAHCPLPRSVPGRVCRPSATRKCPPRASAIPPAKTCRRGSIILLH